MIEAHLLFCTACLCLFTNYNLFLQRGDPLAHKVFSMTKELIRKIAPRFLQTSCYHGEDITDEDIQRLNKLFKEGDTDQTQYNTVPEAKIAFYRESLRYVLDKMDMSCYFWGQAVWTDFFNKDSANWSHVEYFLNTFINVLPNDDEKMDRLYEEFTDYKTLSISDLPDTALADALTASYEDHDKYCLDIIWYNLYQMKSLI